MKAGFGRAPRKQGRRWAAVLAALAFQACVLPAVGWGWAAGDVPAGAGTAATGMAGDGREAAPRPAAGGSPPAGRAAAALPGIERRKTPNDCSRCGREGAEEKAREEARAVPRPPSDAFLHGTAGAGLALLAAAVSAGACRKACGGETGAVLCPPAAGLGAALAGAAGKELLDMAGFGRPQWSDFRASAVGGAVASAAALLLYGVARHAELDERIVPFVLASAGAGLLIPAVEAFLQRVGRRLRGSPEPAAGGQRTAP